jgi:predicted LPLAT superfamily acyltransferase
MDSALVRGRVSNAQAQWLRERERGTMFGIRALLFAHRVFGRGFAVLILRIVAFYYACFAGSVRRASRDYLRRVGEDPGFLAVVRHIATFAICAFDRVLFAAGKVDGFAIERTGHDYLAALVRDKRGAILLGAHLGSFEALRAMGGREGLPVNVLAHFANARKITALLRTVAPEFAARVIEIDPDAPHYVLAVRERIEAGELVAVLGDRTGLGEGVATVDFFGGRAALPTGAYALAAVLHCPIYLTFGLFLGGNRYSLHCEPFADAVELPRGARPARLQAYAQRYADRLEVYVRKAPYCWFNFFDFWK